MVDPEQAPRRAGDVRSGSKLRRAVMLQGCLALLSLLLVLMLVGCGLTGTGADQGLKPVKFELARYQAEAQFRPAQQLPLPRVEAVVLDCSALGGGECSSSSASAVEFEELVGQAAVRGTEGRCETGGIEDCTLMFTPEAPSLTVWLRDGSYAIEAQAYAVESGLPTEYCQPSKAFAVGPGQENAVVITLTPCVFTGQFVYVDSHAGEGGNGSHANPFKTVSEALEAVEEGGTIWLGAGAYVEDIVIDKDITLRGADGATVVGTVAIVSDGVTLENLDVAVTSTGDANMDLVVVNDARYVTLQNVDISFTQDPAGEPLAFIAGVRVLGGVGGGNASGFTMTGGSIKGVSHGIIAEHKATGVLTFENVHIDGVNFEDISWRGIYLETLADAVIENVTMHDVGNFGGNDGSGNYGLHGSGIDINLKWADYANITLRNVTISDSGRSDKDGAGAPHDMGAAVTIKARDDGPTYGADPATLDNVEVDGLTISVLDPDLASAAGLRFGESDQVNDTPTNVVVKNTTISDAHVHAVMNYTNEEIDLTDSGNEVAREFWDAIDDPRLGLIREEAGRVFVVIGDSIQNAIDAASAGETIDIEFGNYTAQGPFTVDKPLTFVGNGATAQSAFIAADDVTIRDLDFQHSGHVVRVSDASRLTLVDVDIEYTGAVGGGTGIAFVNREGNADYTGFRMQGGSVRGANIGLSLDHRDENLGGVDGRLNPIVFDDIEIDGTLFEDTPFKAIYVEALSNAVIRNVTIRHAGNHGFSDSNPDQLGKFGAGIDINLKYGDYESITLEAVTIEASGYSDGGGELEPDPTGAAVTIKARDDGSYATNPATLDDVQISGVIIVGGSVGLRLGEYGKINGSPTNVTISGTTITQSDDYVVGDYYAVMNYTVEDVDARHVLNEIQGEILDASDDGALGAVLLAAE